MHSTHMKTPGIALAVLCAASVLTLSAAKAVIAQSHVQTVETSQEVAGVCAEQHRLALVLQPLETYLAIADQYVPETYAAPRPQPEEIGRVELQVPAALLRTLLMEEGSNRSVELHVPAACLTTLSTEGWVQRPQGSSELWGSFSSLY